MLLVGGCCRAQQVGRTHAGRRARLPATFNSSTQLVVETVAVKDKSGKPVEGLTAKDFTVTEDGVPQTISFFEYQKLPERNDARRWQRTEPENIHVYDKLPRTTDRAGVARRVPVTKTDRLLALYFDMTRDAAAATSCAPWPRRRSSSGRR